MDLRKIVGVDVAEFRVALGVEAAGDGLVAELRVFEERR